MYFQIFRKFRVTEQHIIYEIESYLTMFIRLVYHRFNELLAPELIFLCISVFGIGLNCFKSKLSISARYECSECKFSFWYIEVFA